MKVLNYTTSYFAVILLVIISIWAGIFYYAMLDEIYDSIDDGLDNQKGLILQKAARDTSLLRKTDFEEGDYNIKEISPQFAKSFLDVYADTMMYMQNEKDFEPVRLLRTIFFQDGKYYQMQVITSMVEEDDLVAELFYALLWLYLGLVATILILNNFLLKRIWKPFYYLLKQIKKFKLENTSGIKIKNTGIDEFRLLNETVQKLIQNNIDSYNIQKHFIENASHELQTPLAISINKLEALAETGTLGEAEAQLLAASLDNLAKLTRLNKSLLLLSRIKNKQFAEEQAITVNTVVKRIVADFSDQLSYSELSIEVKENDAFYVKMNADLADILITNLIKNTIVHNYRQGKINIYIDKTSLRIENTGMGQALDQQKLFTRFNKEQSLTSSTGLGLSIVKAIADIYSFNISYAYSGMHIITVAAQ